MDIGGFGTASESAGEPMEGTDASDPDRRAGSAGRVEQAQRRLSRRCDEPLKGHYDNDAGRCQIL